MTSGVLVPESGVVYDCGLGVGETRLQTKTISRNRTTPTRRFELVLVEPSKYDDQGYVVQWVKSAVPSSALAMLYGLAVDSGERRVLGDVVEIVVTGYDETNTRIRIDRIIKRIQRAGGHGMVGLVGVQTNQFPRALDLARP